MQIADSAQVTTAAAAGKTGTWLIDPVDFTVAASGGDISNTTLSANLQNGNVMLRTNIGAQPTFEFGNMFINDTVTWAANNLLLLAGNNIYINANLNGSGTASLFLAYGLDYRGGPSDGVGGKYGRSSGAQVILPAGNFSIISRPCKIPFGPARGTPHAGGRRRSSGMTARPRCRG